MTLRTCGLSLWLNFLFPCLNAYHQIATGPVPFGACISPAVRGCAPEMGLGHEPAVLRSWGMRSSQKWETWARRGFPQPRASPVGLLALEKGAVTVRCSGPSAWCCLLLPQHHPFTPDASLSRPPYTRTMEVWGDSELSPSPSLMGVSTQVGGGNIVLPSDLQDTASPSQKTPHIDPFPGDSFHRDLTFYPLHSSPFLPLSALSSFISQVSPVLVPRLENGWLVPAP